MFVVMFYTLHWNIHSSHKLNQYTSQINTLIDERKKNDLVLPLFNIILDKYTKQHTFF